jgi:integrase
MTFSAFAQHWLETWAVRNGTRKRYRQAVREAEAVFGSKLLSEIDRADAERLVRCMKKGRSPATVARLLAGLSALFAAAVDAGEIPHSPLGNRGMLLRRTGMTRSHKAEPKFYSDENVGIILTALDNWPTHDAAAVLLMLRLGLTKSEVLGLRVEDLDFEANEVTIRRGYTPEDGAGPTKTEARNRRLPLLPNLAARLKVLVAENTLQRRGVWLFPALSGRPDRPMSPARFEQRIRARLEQAGISPPRKFLHAFRHTFARSYLRKGGSIEKLSPFMGHSNITTTFNTYGGLRARDIDRALLEDVA